MLAHDQQRSAFIPKIPLEFSKLST